MDSYFLSSFGVVSLFSLWFIIVRDELYKECVAALQGGLLLNGKDFNAIRKALEEAFERVDAKLLDWYACRVFFVQRLLLIVEKWADSE